MYVYSRIFKPIHPPNVFDTWPELTKLGRVDPDKVPAPSIEVSEEEERTAKARALLPDPSVALNLDDIETLAETVLSATAWAYYSSAGDDEVSKCYSFSSVTGKLSPC
jgi:L-lactate dehydrogenase (cytochrome)